MMAKTYPYTDTLYRSDLLAGLEAGAQAEILNRGQRHLLPSGQTLFAEGDPALRCYGVLKGRLKLGKLHEEGRETLVRYIHPGEITAAVALFREKDYPVTAVAVGPTEVISWDRETMRELMTSYPDLAVNLLHLALERLDDMQNRYLALQAERVEQRLARAVLRFMKQSGLKTDEGVLIDFRLSRRDLADYTGTTLYTVNRTISNWEKKGWITAGRERIVVTDLHALVAFAETG